MDNNTGSDDMCVSQTKNKNSIREKIRLFFEKIDKNIIEREEKRKLEYAEFLAKQKQEKANKDYIKQIQLQKMLNDYDHYLLLGYCPLCSRYVNSYNKLYYDENRYVIFCDACQRSDATRSMLAGAIFLDMFHD